MRTNSEKISFDAGSIQDEHFELLLAGTSIRGDGIVAALREHLVGGSTAKDACEKYGVNKGQFSRRLKVLLQEHERTAKLSVFYHKW